MSEVRVPRTFVAAFDAVARAQRWDAATREELRGLCRTDIKWRAWISVLADSYANGYHPHAGNGFMRMDRWRVAVGLSSVQDFTGNYIQQHGRKTHEASSHPVKRRQQRAQR